MSINAGFFPPYGCRRKNTTAAYHLPLNNQQHHPTSILSARSLIESTNGSESFLPSISSATGARETHKPYRRNDFANNHLFIAKRKLTQVFLGQPARNLQSTSDLIHLFDQYEPKRKNRSVSKHQRQENNNDKMLPGEPDFHLSVVDLVVRPPQPSANPRDPLATLLRHRRPQNNSGFTRPRQPSFDARNTSAKPNITLVDDSDADGLTDQDNVSENLNATKNLFDSSLLSVRPIVPSAGPQHFNPHLLQHR